MDSYIVRIHRRLGRGRALVGVVEDVGAPGRRAFSDPEALWEILTVRRSRRGHGRPAGVTARRRSPAP